MHEEKGHAESVGESHHTRTNENIRNPRECEGFE